ncbi:hypothetical protein BD408DRAFT_424559 [Parasitella parasitica]|nr:hypothetical protein BD408DRAFT_424559 [Parasitella parasitica]
MLEDPQATTNLLKRGNELNFLPSASTSPLVQGDATATTDATATATLQQQQQQSPERSSELNQQHLNRKLLSRHQSITRGTASSRAKAVRSNLNDTASTTTSHTAEAIIKRKLSAAVRARKQSFTAAAATVQAPPTIVENKPLLNVALPSYPLGQRRSSWSPQPQQQQQQQQQQQKQQQQQHVITTTLAPELPSSPSPSPPPAVRKVLEAKRRASMIPNATIRDTTPPNGNSSDGPIAIPSSDNNLDGKRHYSRGLQKRPSVIMNTDDGNQHNKAASVIMDNNDAAPSAGNQQQTPCSKSESDSCSEAENSPDFVADEAIAIRRPLSDSSSSTSSYLEHTHTHTHSEDDHLPGYMRRPICAACNRNVKVTSSSESTTAAAAAGAGAGAGGTTGASVKLAKSNSTLASSRRASFSTTATTTSRSHEGASIKKRLSASVINEQNQPLNVASATLSMSTVGSQSSGSSSSNHSGPTTKAQRSHSPTSPIPTRKRTKNKSALSSRTIAKKPPSQLIEKWSHLLSQQQQLLATISGDCANANDDQELNDIQQNITKLVTSTQEQYETVLLETQAKILQKFTLLMMQQVQQQQQLQQQQQQQKQQHHHHKDALLFLSSSAATTSLPFGVSGSAATITPINIYNEHNQNTLDTATATTTTTMATTNTTITDEQPRSSNWQTKLEYGVTRFKWGMSQWIGSIAGTGEIEEQDFDTLGYPENVIISGVCVTTEPGLLPKGLQKYFKPYQQPDQVICHKYIIKLSRQARLTRFQLLDQDEWIQDDDAKMCEFKIQDRHDYIKRTKHCDAKFGVFQRRHHCRSCGHVFCHEHSSNKLPLFVSNGQDCGEWARVCDTCFYSRIEPQLLTRS